jgi:hypothetical protein
MLLRTFGYHDTMLRHHDRKHHVDFLFALIIHQYTRPTRYRHHGWLHSGQVHVNNLLGCGHAARILSALRMSLPVFYKLRDWLHQNMQLQGRISIEEASDISFHCGYQLVKQDRSRAVLT